MQSKVRAQGETVLAVVPEVTNLYFNGELSSQVQVNISNVTLLNAFDITLRYDQSIASVLSYSYQTGFLSGLYCYREINNPGYLRLACFQVGKPGVSGSGSLINLVFNGDAAGITPITIDAEALDLSDINSQPIYATLHHATVNVGYAASTVYGNFLLQGQSDRSGIPVSLGVGVIYQQGPFETLSIPTIGQNLVLTGVVNNDSYTLTTTQPGYLNIDARLGKTVTVPPGADVSLPTLRLLAGDVVADNMINTTDLDAIRDAFGMTGEGLAGDVNSDGIVNARDLALVAGNFGQTSETAYGGWLP